MKRSKNDVKVRVRAMEQLLTGEYLKDDKPNWVIRPGYNESVRMDIPDVPGDHLFDENVYLRDDTDYVMTAGPRKSLQAKTVFRVIGGKVEYQHRNRWTAKPDREEKASNMMRAIFRVAEHESGSGIGTARKYKPMSLLGIARKSGRTSKDVQDTFEKMRSDGYMKRTGFGSSYRYTFTPKKN